MSNKVGTYKRKQWDVIGGGANDVTGGSTPVSGIRPKSKAGKGGWSKRRIGKNKQG